MRRKEKTKIAQIKNLLLIPALVTIIVLPLTLDAFAIELWDGGFGGGDSGSSGIIEATQPAVDPINDFVDWSNSIETPSELNPDTIGNYDNIDGLLDHLSPDNYIDNIFSGIPTQKEINDLGNYTHSLQNIDSIISESLSTIETQLNMSYRELSKVINPNRSLVDPPTLLIYNDQLLAAKKNLQVLQNSITTRLENVNGNISQLLSDIDKESENAEGEGENLAQILKSAQEIYDNTKPETVASQTMDINEISNGIEPPDEFSELLSITAAEIATLQIFPQSVRADLEDIVVDKLNDKLKHYQKILGQLTAFEPNKTVSEIRDTVSSRIEDLNARLNEINTIDDHPFSLVYTGNEQGPRGIIDKAIELSNQFNNFENLTDQEKNDLKTSVKFYQNALKLFILTEPEIQKLQTACDTSNIPSNTGLEDMTVREWDAYTTLKNKLSDFKHFLIGSEYSSKPPLQETIRKIVTALESISSGIETASANPEQLNNSLSETNNKLLSEFLGVPIDVTTIHSTEDLLAQLGIATSDEFEKRLKTVKDEIAFLQILPPDFRIGYSSWSQYKSVNEYIGSQIRESNPKDLLDKLNAISKTSSSLSPIINEAIAILSARVEVCQSKGQTLYELEKFYNKHTSYEGTDFILSLDSVANGNQTLLGLAKEQGLELKTMLKQLQSSGTINTDKLNTIKTLLTNYIAYLHKAEDTISKSSYLKENGVFKEAFEYLEKLYPDLSTATTEIGNLVTVVDELLDVQNTLHTVATIQNNIESIETQSAQLEEKFKTASIIESPKTEKTLIQLYEQRNQLGNQLHSLIQKTAASLEFAIIGCDFVDGNITFTEAQRRIAESQQPTDTSPSGIPQPAAAGTTTPSQEGDVTISVQGGPSDTPEPGDTLEPRDTATYQGAAELAGYTTVPQGYVIPATGFGGDPTNAAIAAGNGTIPKTGDINIESPMIGTQSENPTLTRNESEALSASFSAFFDNLRNNDTKLPSTMSDLYSGLSNPDTVSDTLASVFNSPPINQENHFTDEQTVILSMFGMISLGDDYSNNPVLSSAVYKVTQKILNSYDNTLRGILPEQVGNIIQHISQNSNFNIQQFGKETGLSEDFITQIVALVKSNPEISSDFQLKSDSISAPIGYVAIDGEKGFVTFTANKNIQPYNLEKFQKLSDDEITALSKSVNISEAVLRQIRDNISNRSNGVFVMITVDIDGKKVPVLVLADTIVYINSTKPTEVAKEILKHILINRPNASEALVNKAFLLIVIIGLICVGFGIGLAVYITRLQLKKSNYFNPVLSHKKAYQHNFAPSWKTR